MSGGYHAWSMTDGVPVRSMKQLFERALQLEPPWRVVTSDFDFARQRVDLRVGFRAGSRFPCPQCGRSCQAVEFTEGTWRQPEVMAFEASAAAFGRELQDAAAAEGIAVPELPISDPMPGRPAPTPVARAVVSGPTRAVIRERRRPRFRAIQNNLAAASINDHTADARYPALRPRTVRGTVAARPLR